MTMSEKLWITSHVQRLLADEWQVCRVYPDADGDFPLSHGTAVGWDGRRTHSAGRRGDLRVEGRAVGVSTIASTAVRTADEPLDRVVRGVRARAAGCAYHHSVAGRGVDRVVSG